MAATALVEPDVFDPTDEELDRGFDENQETHDRPTDAESEEPYLGAREAWVLTKLTREMVISQGPNPTGLVVPEANFSFGPRQKIRRPDLAFVSAERWPIDEPAPADQANWRLVPDLAVEIVSPTDLVAELMSKIEQYFAAGVRLVWTIHPEFRKVYIYRSTKIVTILDQDDTLDGGDVIAGFAMPLRIIFPAPRVTTSPPQP